MNEEITLRQFKGYESGIASLKRSVRRLMQAVAVLAACLIVMLACGARWDDDEVDHDIVLKNHKLLVKDDDGNERMRIAADKIVLKDDNGTPRIQIAIEQNGRAGIHFYSQQGLKRMFVGCDQADVPIVLFFDRTGTLPHRRIVPDGPNL